MRLSAIMTIFLSTTTRIQKTYQGGRREPNDFEEPVVRSLWSEMRRGSAPGYGARTIPNKTREKKRFRMLMLKQFTIPRSRER